MYGIFKTEFEVYKGKTYFKYNETIAYVETEKEALDFCKKNNDLKTNIRYYYEDMGK